MNWAPAVVVVAVTLTACTPAPPADSPTTTAQEPTSTTVAPASVPDCLAGTLPFAAQGIVAALDSPRPDATTIGGIRWQREEECERIVIEFLADGGSPATRLGPVGVTLAPDSGIVRISLPDEVGASAIGDSVITGSLVDRIYVVEGIEDGAHPGPEPCAGVARERGVGQGGAQQHDAQIGVAPDGRPRRLDGPVDALADAEPGPAQDLGRHRRAFSEILHRHAVAVGVDVHVARLEGGQLAQTGVPDRFANP